MGPPTSSALHPRHTHLLASWRSLSLHPWSGLSHDSSLLMVEIKGLGLSVVLLRDEKCSSNLARHSASRKIPGTNVNLERVLSVMPLLKRGHINETRFRRFSFFIADLS